MPLGPVDVDDLNPPGPAAQPEAPSVEAILPSWDEVRQLLVDLVPAAGEKISFLDCSGAEHRVVPLLAARTQLELVATLDAVDFAELRDMLSGGGNLIQKIARAARDAIGAGPYGSTGPTGPSLLDRLEDLFVLVHGQALVDRARENCDAMNLPLPTRKVGPADVFPVEEMIAGLLPFCGRPIARALAVADAVQARRTPSN